MTKLIAVIGKNGSGKNTLLDTFGFVSDCLTMGVEAACDQQQRGGFERLRSMGVVAPISFEIYHWEAPDQRPITYELAIGLDASGRPFPFRRLARGRGWCGREKTL